jgi:hypothetical protein
LAAWALAYELGDSAVRETLCTSANPSGQPWSNLLPASNETEEKFIVRKIIGKKTEKKIIYYLVWFNKSLKKNATWEPRSKLLEDNLDEYIKEYEDDCKIKRMKKRLKEKANK